MKINLFNNSSYISRRNKPINLEKKDEKLFIHEFKKKIPKSRLKVKKNIYIKESRLKKFKYFRFNYSSWRMSDFDFKWKIKFFIEDFNSFIKSENNENIVTLEKGTWVIDQKSWKYFHWLTDCLQRILFAESNTNKFPILLSSNYFEYEYIKECLEILKIPYVKIDKNKTYKVNDLIIAEHVAPSGNYNKDLILEVSEKLLGSVKDLNNNTETKIWVSRQNSQHRKIHNFEEIIPIIEANGFTIISFENYKLTDQINLVRKATTLAGLHGAGLTNMLFMKKGSKILEIRDKNDNKNNCYFTMASDLDLNFYYFLGESIDKNNLYSSDYILDPKKLDYLLRQL